MKHNNIISIETSCDDTSIAVIIDNKIVSNVTISSAQIQNQYGGVVPEVAAREHEKNIIKAFIEATKDIDLNSINCVAYTAEPGLRVSLNVGEAFATTLASILNVKLEPINHIYSHIFSFAYEIESDIQYPFISLVVSGGHTSIFLVKNPKEIIVLNETQDDALGEVYDKVARSLSLGYPGGPVIDKMFDINKADIKFLNNLPSSSNHFSFSGLKTNVLNYINSQRMKNIDLDIVQITSSFQKTAIDIVMDKVEYYLKLNNINNLAIGGGVSANNYLQERIKKLNLQKCYIPKYKWLCGDNAAMIAIYANLLLNSKN